MARGHPPVAFVLCELGLGATVVATSITGNKGSGDNAIPNLKQRLTYCDETSQVGFEDYSGVLDMSAVQTDQASSYMAEETSFTGFEGEGVVFSEGQLFMDSCDFSGSTASLLVYSEPGSTTVIRNAVLGDNNYVTLADASSKARELPGATSFTNGNLRCGDAGGGDSASISPNYPCSEGSTCLNGDLGVYCGCYLQLSDSEERCMSGDATALNLTQSDDEEETVYPALLERDLLLSYESATLSSGAGEGGVVWSVESFSSRTVNMNWTVFPPTGRLLPGGSITPRVVTLPSASFDGTTNVTFAAVGVGPPTTTLASTYVSSGNDAGKLNSTAAQQAQGGDPFSSSEGGGHSALQETSTGEVGATVSFEVTYFHCAAGTFWNGTTSSENGLDENVDTCPLCTDGVGGETEGADCTKAGATIEALRIKKGYWRATLEVPYVRECSNKDACRGGSIVQSVEEYCNEGYEGVVCSVCSSGYGRGASEQCHICTSDFKGAMYFVLAVALVVTLVVIALLAVYLVRGRDAVSSTMASTRESVRVLRRRSDGILSRSGGGGCTDVGGANVSGATSKGVSSCTDGLPQGTAESMTTHNGKSSVDRTGDRNGETSINRSGVRTRTDVQHDARVLLPTSTVHTAPVYVGKNASFPTEAWAPPVTEAPHRALRTNDYTDEAREVSDPSGTVPTELTFSRTNAEPAPEEGQGLREPKQIRQSQTTNEGSVEANTSSTKIAGVLAGLPLSKIKVVIVVWQISSAFAEVTNVSFPPIYKTFLSIIGLFSLDLGWILSATCMASDIDFYDKLLIVTIGPMFFLGFLGITFHIGASRTRRGISPAEPGRNARKSFRTPKEVPLPVSSNAKTFPAIMPEERFASPQSMPHATVGNLHSQLRPPIETGVEGADSPPTASADPAGNLRDDWGLGGRGEGEAGAARVSSIPPGAKERTLGASTRSLRSIWKAGPGNSTNPEQNQLWGLFARHTTMSLIILYLVYGQVSTVVFQTFACEDYPEINKRYLRADGRIACDTAKHTGFKAYAAVMICLYPIGIPAVFLYLLVRQRSDINPPTDESLKASRGAEHVVREKINQRANDESIEPISFLWGAYYPNRYYYEVFECMRRLLLTGLLVLVHDTSGQVAYGCIFAFISLWAFELQRPHIDALEIQLYRAGCLVIFFTNFLALIIQAELAEEDSNSSAVYAVVLVMTHVFFILSICWSSWATMKATFSRGHFQGVVLGVDIVGEDSACMFLGLQKETRSQLPSEGEEA